MRKAKYCMMIIRMAPTPLISQFRLYFFIGSLMVWVRTQNSDHKGIAAYSLSILQMSVKSFFKPNSGCEW